MLRTRLGSQRVPVFSEPHVQHFLSERGAFTLRNLKEPSGGLFTMCVFKLACFLRDLRQKLILVCPKGSPFGVVEDHPVLRPLHRDTPRKGLLIQVRERVW